MGKSQKQKYRGFDLTPSTDEKKKMIPRRNALFSRLATGWMK